MRKFFIIISIFFIFLLTIDIAQAWHKYPYRHHYRDFGIYIGPPVIVIAPPIYYRWYYPPYPYHPSYDCRYGYRVWVPGHWEERWTPYGWERVWVPGYWRYNR